MKVKHGFTIVGVVATLAAGAWAQSIERLDLAHLALPASLGKVQERFAGTNPRWVVHIQDVHQHLTAQENISAILEHLTGLYGIRTIALEGGWSASSLPQSHALPNSREKQSLARALLEDGHLSGPPYAALFSEAPLELVGLEERALYEEGRQIYLNYLVKRTEIGALVEALEQKYRQKKSQVFNSDLQNFDEAVNGFRLGKKAQNFLPSLVSLAEGRGVSLEDLPQLDLFRQILEIEKGLSKEKLHAEALRLGEAFQGTRMNFEELLLSGRIPSEKLEFYPEAQKYHELLKLEVALSYTEFFEEIEEAIRRVKDKLFISDEERALDDAWERFALARKLLLFQATPTDLSDFEPERSLAEAELAEAGLGPVLELALSFYDLARRRDEIFFEKITTDPRLAGDLIVVTGGFHTAGLTQKLREIGISFVVIAPDLANEAPSEELYFQRLQDPIRSAQTLSDAQNRFLLPEFDPSFVRGVKVLETTKNLNGAREEVLKAVGLAPRAGRPSEAEAPAGVFQDFSPGEFLALPRPDQKAEVRRWLEIATDGKLAIVMILKTRDAINLLKDELALAVWERDVAPQRANTIGEVRDVEEYLSEMLGIKARVVRIPVSKEGLDIDTVINQRFQGEKNRRVVAVINNEYETNEWIVGLPLKASSLLLARLALEQGFPRSLPPQFRARLDEILREIFVEDGVIRRAA